MSQKQFQNLNNPLNNRRIKTLTCYNYMDSNNEFRCTSLGKTVKGKKYKMLDN